MEQKSASVTRIGEIFIFIEVKFRKNPVHSSRSKSSAANLTRKPIHTVDKTLSYLYPVSAYAISLPINSAGCWRFAVTTYRLRNRKSSRWRVLPRHGLQTARSVQGESETLHVDATPLCTGRRPAVNGCSG